MAFIRLPVPPGRSRPAFRTSFKLLISFLHPRRPLRVACRIGAVVDAHVIRDWGKASEHPPFRSSEKGKYKSQEPKGKEGTKKKQLGKADPK